MQPLSSGQRAIADEELNIDPVPCRSPDSKFQKLMKKIWKVTKYILKAVVGIAFLIASPAFTVVGFAFGFLDPKDAAPIIGRITEVWHKLPWACVIAAGAATFIALPVTIAVSSFLYGSYLGLSTSRYVDKLPDERPDPNAPSQEEIIRGRRDLNPASLEGIVRV